MPRSSQSPASRGTSNPEWSRRPPGGRGRGRRTSPARPRRGRWRRARSTHRDWRRPAAGRSVPPGWRSRPGRRPRRRSRRRPPRSPVRRSTPRSRHPSTRASTETAHAADRARGTPVPAAARATGGVGGRPSGCRRPVRPRRAGGSRRARLSRSTSPALMPPMSGSDDVVDDLGARSASVRNPPIATSSTGAAPDAVELLLGPGRPVVLTRCRWRQRIDVERDAQHRRRPGAGAARRRRTPGRWPAAGSVSSASIPSSRHSSTASGTRARKASAPSSTAARPGEGRAPRWRSCRRTDRRTRAP